MDPLNALGEYKNRYTRSSLTRDLNRLSSNRKGSPQRKADISRYNMDLPPPPKPPPKELAIISEADLAK
jgi:hypothetical protein